MQISLALSTVASSILSAFPAPSLSLDFRANTLDPRITFTRASSGTHFDSTGRLVTDGYNLLTHSQNLGQASWQYKTGASISSSNNTAHDGTSTAALVSGASAMSWTVNCVVNAVSSLSSSTVYTGSYYVKSAGVATVAQVGLRDGSTGVFHNSASTPISSTVWTRLSVTATTGAATSQFALAIGGANGDILVSGPQLELGSTATQYAPTTTAASSGPRFDYDPATLLPRGLLIEEQRTNSIRNTTATNGSAAGTPGTFPTNWTITGSGTGTLTRTVATGTLNGMPYIDIRFQGTTSTIGLNIATDPSTNGAATVQNDVWTGSWYAALVAGSFSNVSTVKVGVAQRDAAGALTGTTTSGLDLKGTLTSTFVRHSISATMDSATAAWATPIFIFTWASGVAVDFTIRLACPQLEKGAFPTSYIPTTTATATRAADSASMTGTNFSSWFNASAGTFVVETYRADQTAINRVAVSADDNTTNERIEIRYSGASGTSTRFEVVDGGVQQVSTTGGSYGNLRKHAFAYANNDFAAIVDGSVLGTDTSGTTPTPNQLQLGKAAFALSELNGHIRSIRYYNTRLPNATLTALTA